MAKLGECLVFYLKYPMEMRKLEGDQDLEGLVEKENTKKMAAQVAAQSNQDAAEFLESCGTLIAQHFSSIGNPDIAKRGRVETRKTWSISYGIWPATRQIPTNKKWRMKAGVDIKEVDPNKFEVIAWLWRKGEDEGERTMRVVLDNKLSPRDLKEVGFEEGYVALATVTLTPPAEGFEIDREPILDEINNAFKRIRKDQFITLYPN